MAFLRNLVPEGLAGCVALAEAMGRTQHRILLQRTKASVHGVCALANGLATPLLRGERCIRKGCRSRVASRRFNPRGARVLFWMHQGWPTPGDPSVECNVTKIHVLRLRQVPPAASALIFAFPFGDGDALCSLGNFRFYLSVSVVCLIWSRIILTKLLWNWGRGFLAS